MKHIKHWLMTIAALLCSITASAHDFEVDGIYYNITSEEDLTVAVTYQGPYYYTYDNEYTGTVVIPETVTYGYIYTVTSIGYEAFAGCKGLTSVTIPNSVTSIDSYAFNACIGLTEITIPEGVTSIGFSAFNNCYSLTSITIPDNVTSIQKYAFSGCKGLTSVTIPNRVTMIYESAFSSCSGLTEVTIPNSVTMIYEGAFCECTGLTSVTIPNSVKSIGKSAFSDCTNLSEITIPNSVTSIGDKAFRNCTSLTTVNFNAENCTRMGGDGSYSALNGCKNLTTINIGDKVKKIPYYAFGNCTGLTEITIPSSVTSIGSYAFYYCTGLTEIRVEATTPSTIYSYTFAQVDKSIPVYVPASALSTYQSAEYWSDFTNIQPIVEPVPEDVTLTISEYGSGTYCSEYALDFSEVEGLKAYAATGYDSETGVVTLTRVMTAKAGMGLFIKGEPGDYVVPTLESTSFNTLNMLVGTLEDIIVNGTDGLYTNYKYAAPDGEPLFYQFADGSTQKAGRAYLQIPTSWLTTTTAKSISYRFDDGETTDIENSEITTPNSEFIYDLYGRRVENPVKGGVYIVKGKKIVY